VPIDLIPAHQATDDTPSWHVAKEAHAFAVSSLVAIETNLMSIAASKTIPGLAMITACRRCLILRAQFTGWSPQAIVSVLLCDRRS
jgi:hypothetical protein